MTASQTSISVTSPAFSAFKWGLCAPLLLLLLVVSAWLLFQQDMPLASLPFTALIAWLSYCFCGYWLIHRKTALASQKQVLWFLQIVAALYLTTLLSAARFVSATGAPLDLHLIVFTLLNLREVSMVASSEIPASLIIILLDLIAILLILPRVILRRITARSPEPRTTVTSPPRHLQTGAMIVGCVGILATGISGAGGLISRIDQMPLIHTMLSDAGADPESIPAGLRRTNLRDTYLSPRNGTAELKGQTQTPAAARNLVIVILESVRAESTTLHDATLPTTPFLASLAPTSTVINHAYSIVPHTTKALISMLCGIEPDPQMAPVEARRGIPANCLATLLDQVGYETVFFQSATEKFEDRAALVRQMGYQQFFPLETMDRTGFSEVNYFGYEDQIMLEPSRRWLQNGRDPDKPFFATYLTVTPHHDYHPPRNDPALRAHATDPLELRYLNAVAHVDDFLKDLVQQYKDLGLYDNTLFVFMGDHGEAFGEHGRYQHDNVLWNQGLHVPFLIHDPSDTEGRAIDPVFSQIDLLPTLTAMLGFDIKGGHYPGVMLGQSPADRNVYAHCWYPFRCIALVNRKNKFIDHYGWTDAQYFDLEQDPGETTNVIDTLSEEQLARIRTELAIWRRQVQAVHRGLVQ